MKKIGFAAICLGIWLGAWAGSAAEFAEERLGNWHQWRGPDANGYAPRGNPPLQWSKQSGIRWKVPIPGRGTSTPVIWGDRLFLLTAIRTAGEGNSHQFAVLCIDRQTGKTLWQRTAIETVPHQGHHQTSTFVASSPVTDGRHLYVSFGSRGVYCFDMDGNEQWRADLGRFEIKFGFGEGSSPALHGDTLVVNCDHEGESFITALDARSGERKWTVARDENSTWNTPLITEHAGRAQVVVNGAKRSRSYDLADGRLIWEYGAPPGVDAIPSPLRVGDLAICAGGLRGDPIYAIPLGSTGNLTGTDKIAWLHSRGTPQIATPVLVGERLYFTKGRLGIVSCLDARTGKVIIEEERLPLLGDVYPSPVAAAGRVYFTTRSGTTVVIDARSSQVEVLAENRLDEVIVASPAIVGSAMYIRGEESLYLIGD